MVTFYRISCWALTGARTWPAGGHLLRPLPDVVPRSLVKWQRRWTTAQRGTALQIGGRLKQLAGQLAGRLMNGRPGSAGVPPGLHWGMVAIICIRVACGACPAGRAAGRREWVWLALVCLCLVAVWAACWQFGGALEAAGKRARPKGDRWRLLWRSGELVDSEQERGENE